MLRPVSSEALLIIHLPSSKGWIGGFAEQLVEMGSDCGLEPGASLLKGSWILPKTLVLVTIANSQIHASSNKIPIFWGHGDPSKLVQLRQRGQG